MPCCSSDARGDAVRVAVQSSDKRSRPAAGTASGRLRRQRARRPAHPEIRRRWGQDALLQFRCPRRRGAGCSTELPRHDGGALGARAFWPASDRETPPRSGDHSRSGTDGLLANHTQTKEPACGRRGFRPPSAAAGQKARAPRDTASVGAGCPAAVPMPAATRCGLQYRAASTRRRRSGCAGLLARFRQRNAAAKRRPQPQQHRPTTGKPHADKGAGLRPARLPAAFGGSGPEGPRTQRYGVGGGRMPCCSSDARGDAVRVAVQSCLDTTEALWVRGSSDPLPTETRRREAATTAAAAPTDYWQATRRQRSQPAAGTASGRLRRQRARRPAHPSAAG